MTDDDEAQIRCNRRARPFDVVSSYATPTMHKHTLPSSSAAGGAPHVNSTAPTATAPHLFKVNLGAIITLLSLHLYSQGPDVVIRELMQNGVDAHTARRLADPSWHGRIVLEMQPLPTGEWLLIVADDGIGVHPDEVASCFATIGDSFKRGANAGSGDGAFLGRFGVGQLSAFIVADEMTILSRKVTTPNEPQAPAFRWTGRKDGTWDMELLDGSLDPGTRVHLKLPSDWTPEKVLKLARKFGRFLAVPIILRSPDGDHVVTETPPWAKDADERELIAKGSELFDGEEFTAAFRFHDDATATRGIAFISSNTVAPGTQPLHRLYVRGMYVSDKVRGLTPAYAPFLRVVADSQRLNINAAREDLHCEEDRVDTLAETVGAAMVQWFAECDPERVRGIVMGQHEAILAGVEAGHTVLLRELTRSLPLTTSLGRQTYEQIVRRYRRLEHVDNEKDWGRVELKAKQEGHCVVRSDYRSTDQLLRAVRNHWKGAPVTLVTASEYLGRFAGTTSSRGAEEQRLVDLAARELEKEGCSLEFTEGDDPYELGVLELNDGESIDRFFQSDDDAPETVATKTLRPNRTHPLAERLLAGPDMPEDQLRAWLRVIYQHALLASREVPNGGENRRHARALITIFNAAGGTF